MKVSAFIDSNNLYLAIRAQRWALDYVRFRKYLADKYDVSKAYIFIGFVPGNEALYTELQEAGYITIFKPTLVIKKDGVETVKGNADAELVLHCTKAIYTGACDQAVIVTGDGDFHCLVEDLVNEGKLKRLLVPNKHRYSQLLFKFIKHIDFIGGLKQKLGKDKVKETSTDEVVEESPDGVEGEGTKKPVMA
jgi:uncharacterized LabA/DUF88 family protein